MSAQNCAPRARPTRQTLEDLLLTDQITLDEFKDLSVEGWGNGRVEGPILRLIKRLIG